MEDKGNGHRILFRPTCVLSLLMTNHTKFCGEPSHYLKSPRWVGGAMGVGHSKDQTLKSKERMMAEDKGTWGYG